MQPGSEWVKPISVLAHAAVGCGSAMLSGGNCGRGALAAGISDAAVQADVVKPAALGTWGSFEGAAEAGLVGGVAARITGGKFDDGFTVSAAGYLFNSAKDTLQDSNARHNAAVAEEVKILSSQGYNVLGTEVYAENPELLPYLRRYDIVVQDPDSGLVMGVEVKTTSIGIFRLDPQQVKFDVATVQGGTTILNSITPVNGVMYRAVSFTGQIESMISTLNLASQLNQQKIPWHYTTQPLGH
jgi:hypothetical protein